MSSIQFVLLCLFVLFCTVATKLHSKSRTHGLTGSKLRERGKRALGVLSLSSALMTAPETSVASTQPITSSTENYLPRKLYPGVYGEYCGPTPEVQPTDGCAPHGWHSDQPKDLVDDACRIHDMSYCNCDAEFRKRSGKTVPMLASQVALRFATGNLLKKEGVDLPYLVCIDKADKALIKTGLQLRAREEQLAEEKPEDEPLKWFRDKDSDTLARFEKVNLRVFLASLDSDSKLLDTQRNRRNTLTELEAVRSKDLDRALKANNGRMRYAASDPRVLDDDKALFDLLDEQ